MVPDEIVGRNLPAWAATAGLCTEISRMNGPDWEHVVLRQPGEQRTSRWLVRQAMHEGLHHLDDIATVRASLI